MTPSPIPLIALTATFCLAHQSTANQSTLHLPYCDVRGCTSVGSATLSVPNLHKHYSGNLCFWRKHKFPGTKFSLSHNRVLPNRCGRSTRILSTRSLPTKTKIAPGSIVNCMRCSRDTLLTNGRTGTLTFFNGQCLVDLTSGIGGTKPLLNVGGDD